MARTTAVRKYTAKQAHALMNGELNHQEIKHVNTAKEYRIEKNIPIPGRVKVAKFPLLKMDVGDSFVVTLKEAQSLRSAIFTQHKKSNSKMKWITRTVTGRGRAGKQIRVWRIH